MDLYVTMGLYERDFRNFFSVLIEFALCFSLKLGAYEPLNHYGPLRTRLSQLFFSFD